VSVLSDSMLRNALVVSAALHGLFGVWVEVRGMARTPAWREIADSWTGPGIEIEALAAAPARGGESTSTTAHDAETHDARATPAPTSHDVSTANGAPARELATKEPDAQRTQVVRAKRALPLASDVEPSRVASAVRARKKLETAAPRGSASADGTATPTPPSASTGSADGTTSGSFGAQGLPIGVRHLPRAFTRALSIADRSDPRWLTLSPGPAGEARVEIPVDEDGKLGELAYRDETERDKLLPVVRHLLENTRLLLESGHFSLDPTLLRAGVQRLRVRVEVVERAAASAADGDPNELRELEYEAPTASKPGRGSFALNSGRRVIGWVYVE
jgi:hypothetical protein